MMHQRRGCAHVIWFYLSGAMEAMSNPFEEAELWGIGRHGWFDRSKARIFANRRKQQHDILLNKDQ